MSVVGAIITIWVTGTITTALLAGTALIALWGTDEEPKRISAQIFRTAYAWPIWIIIGIKWIWDKTGEALDMPDHDY